MNHSTTKILSTDLLRIALMICCVIPLFYVSGCASHAYHDGSYRGYRDRDYIDYDDYPDRYDGWSNIGRGSHKHGYYGYRDRDRWDRDRWDKDRRDRWDKDRRDRWDKDRRDREDKYTGSNGGSSDRKNDRVNTNYNRPDPPSHENRSRVRYTSRQEETPRPQVPERKTRAFDSSDRSSGRSFSSGGGGSFQRQGRVNRR